MIRAIMLAAILFVLASAPARAVTVCTLSTGGISFGTYTGTQVTIVGSITIRCVGTAISNYTLKLSSGNSIRFTARQMDDSRARALSYNLYTDPAFTQIWGDGTGVSTFVSGQLRPPIVNIAVPIYGKIPAQSPPASGSYSDTIAATLACTSGDSCPATASFSVTANVASTCVITATNLDFSSYTETQLDGQSEIQLVCTNTTAWNVGLDGGRFPGALTSRRSMAGPGATQLDYQLYSDPARTDVWGDGIGTDTVSGTGTGATQLLNVYGRIPAGQSVINGGYVDTITATVTF